MVAHRFGTGRVGVVLVHQSDGNLCQWVPYARRLARLGYTALALDLRGYGDSASANWHAGNRYGGDVEAAARWLSSHGAEKVFLVGASLGGSAAIDAAANFRPPVAGVVSVSGSADFSDARAAVRRVRPPALFVAGAADLQFADDARSLYRAARAAASRKLTIVADSGFHGVALLTTSALARRAVESFLNTH